MTYRLNIGMWSIGPHGNFFPHNSTCARTWCGCTQHHSDHDRYGIKRQRRLTWTSPASLLHDEWKKSATAT